MSLSRVQNIFMHEHKPYCFINLNHLKLNEMSVFVEENSEFQEKKILSAQNWEPHWTSIWRRVPNQATRWRIGALIIAPTLNAMYS